jgi:hypothetical protein
LQLKAWVKTTFGDSSDVGYHFATASIAKEGSMAVRFPPGELSKAAFSDLVHLKEFLQ